MTESREQIRAEQAAERRRLRDEENARVAAIRDEGKRLMLAKRNGEVPTPVAEPEPNPEPELESPVWESTEEESMVESTEPDYESDGGQ